MGEKGDPRIKDEKLYQRLRDEGESKEKAARIANAANKEGRSTIGEKGGEHAKYEKWSVDELQDRAKEIGIENYSDMKKSELINALRHH